MHIIEQLTKFNIADYEFVEIDRDELESYDLSIFQDNNKPAASAICLSHFYAYKEIANKFDMALILEDDVILSSNFSEILQDYITKLPPEFDMCFIGNGCNLHIEKHKLVANQNIYKKDNISTAWGGGGCTRCTDSYIVSKQCAIKICNSIENLNYKIHEAIDWWLNRCCRENNFNVYWAEPTIVKQGSQSGLFKSSH
uniref:Glycosyl transferase family 25 domain-containing protein n=1 Tax=viral metagenome TaxID=1070528 RepID=A0A6C0AN89_9ZZZZ